MKNRGRRRSTLMNDQIRALIWLRAILFARSLSGTKMISIAWTGFLMVVLTFFSLVFAVLMFGMTSAFGTSPENVLGATDLFIIIICAIWLLSLVNELQRSEIIDFRKMLYLPVSLEMVFIMNFLVALLSPILILFILPLVGYTIGLVASRGPGMLFCFPLGIVFYVALSAWVYYVRGILAALLANPRRRRWVLSIVPLLFVMISQLPNLLNFAYRYGNAPSESASRIAHMDIVETLAVPVNLALPPGWFAFGAASLAAGYYGYALLSLGGLVLLCGAGLVLGYRNTRRFYTMSESGGVAQAPPKKTKSVRRERPLRRFPPLPDDVSALVSVYMRTFLRNPQTYVLIVTCMGFMIFPIAMLIVRREAHLAVTFMLPLSFAWPCFSMSSLIQCSLGWDLGGYRSMILLPGSRASYLFAINAAAFPITLGMSLVVVVLAVFLGASGMIAITALLLFVQCYLALCMAANVFGILFPARFNWQGMRRQNKFQLGPLLLMLASPFVYGPAMLCGFAGRLTATSDGFALLCAVILLAATIAAYRVALKRCGRLLQQRELDILSELARDRE